MKSPRHPPLLIEGAARARDQHALRDRAPTPGAGRGRTVPLPPERGGGAVAPRQCPYPRSGAGARVPLPPERGGGAVASKERPGILPPPFPCCDCRLDSHSRGCG